MNNLMALKSPLLRLNKTYLSLLFFLHTFVPLCMLKLSL